MSNALDLVVKLGAREVQLPALSRFDACELNRQYVRAELGILRTGGAGVWASASLLGRLGVGLAPAEGEDWAAHGVRNLRHLVNDAGWSSFEEVSAFALLGIERLMGVGPAADEHAQAIEDFWQARTERARSPSSSSPSGPATPPPGPSAPGRPTT